MYYYMLFLPTDKTSQEYKELEDFKKEIGEMKLPKDNGNGY